MIKNIVFNQTTYNGNKFKSEKLIYKTLKKSQKINNKKNFKELFKTAIVNSSPIFYIKTIKRKRKNSIEFPFMLSKNLRVSYGLKFIIHNSNFLKNSSFYYKLNNELTDSCKKLSKSFKKKETIYKDAFIKKKFSNYRWF